MPIVSHVQLIDKKTCKVFYDKLTYIFVQMPNFNKEIDELETHLDKWLYVLKNLHKFDRIPKKIKEKIFERVFKIAQYHKMSKEEKMAYEDSLKYYRDLKNSLDTAKEEGYEEGYALAEKKYQGKLDQALADQEDAQQKLSRAIKKMLSKGFTINEIAEDMDITIEEAERLSKLSD